MSNPLSRASSLPLLVPMEEAELHTHFKIWESHRFVWQHNDILLRKFQHAVYFLDDCWISRCHFHGFYIQRVSLLSCTGHLQVCTSLAASILLWVSGQPSCHVSGNLLCILSKGTSVYQKRSVRYYSRPLAPNSSMGKVCSGVANTEDAALHKIVCVGSVMCPSSGSCICRLHPTYRR